MIFGAFYSVILWVWGELNYFWLDFDSQKHCPYKQNPVYLNFLDMHIVWCGSNIESADFLLFQGHVNLLHVFLRRH